MVRSDIINPFFIRYIYRSCCLFEFVKKEFVPSFVDFSSNPNNINITRGWIFATCQDKNKNEKLPTDKKSINVVKKTFIIS